MDANLAAQTADLEPVPPTLNPKTFRWLQRRLLNWFQLHQRDLPWRKTTDPYTVWVSEIMLQQTQVSTVIPHFHKFLASFPTLTALARATTPQVLRNWEGLGYYRRARNLHLSAQRIVEHYDGVFPADPAVLQKLPGFGRYTTGAVLSQAFDRRLPILEANSIRVWSRVFALCGDPQRNPTRKQLWQIAEASLPQKNVGAFNQAVMELGALICSPASPNCSHCPIQKRCAANQSGQQDRFPEQGKRPAIIDVREIALIVWKKDRVLLVQRPAQGRWAEMWEFPHGVVNENESNERAAPRVLSELTALNAEVGREVEVIQHGVTHHRIRMVCFEGRYLSGRFQSDFYQRNSWVRLKQLGNYPLSTPQRRLAKKLLQPKQLRLF